jgi:putative GTP pyrophosphokinase
LQEAWQAEIAADYDRSVTEAQANRREGDNLLAAPSTETLRARYQDCARAFEHLREEAHRELNSALAAERIKLHSFSSRVKTESSFLEKVDRKAYADPWNDVKDLVGLRAVSLFLSDIARMEATARSCFTVTGGSETIEGTDPASFGYMSVHLEAKLPAEWVGPRYDPIKDYVFEIQLRTILMDAWANISHHLDYKGETSIPEDLKRDFHALSGLFYVADQHFELFFSRAHKSRVEAASVVKERSEGSIVPINLDTVLSFLHERFPDRKHSEAAEISLFVEELSAAGYTTISALEQALDKSELGFGEEERARGEAYTDVGAARVGLAIADLAYSKAKYGKDSFARYRHLGDT